MTIIPSISCRTLVVLTAVFVTAALAASCQTLRVLYNFSGGGDGRNPIGALTVDSAGNLYGVTSFGGSGGQGVVFKLTSTRDGWMETTLHAFTGGSDGGGPNGGMVLDNTGNLFGTTSYGGATNGGTVFEISPTAEGWTESVIHSFGYPNGVAPNGGLALDATGNLYGTLDISTGGYGAVYLLSPVSGGGFHLTVIHNFQRTDGSNPYGPMVLDKLGNLYGTTSGGGAAGEGTAFRMNLTQHGWNETTLHNFTGGLDGGAPFGGITVSPNGLLYGADLIGGSSYGAAFSMAPPQGNRFQVIHEFGSYAGDARNPTCTFAMDANEDLYCATNTGGVFGGGAILELKPQTNGGWEPATLHSFTGNGQAGPTGDVVLDPSGNLYGVAGGGVYNAGIVYELVR